MKKRLFKKVALGVSSLLFAGALFFNASLVKNELGDSVLTLSSLKVALAQDNDSESCQACENDGGTCKYCWNGQAYVICCEFAT